MLLLLVMAGSLLTVCLTLKKTEYSLYLLIFIIPLVPKIPFIKLSGTYIPVRVEDFFIFAALSVILYKAIRKEITLRNNLNKWLLLFMGIGLASTTLGVLTGTVEKPLLGYLHFLRRVEYIGVFYIALAAIKDLEQVKKVIKYIMVAFTLVILYGILQRFEIVPIYSSMFHDYFFGRPVFYHEYQRVISTFSGPYDFAPYLIIMILVTLSLFVVNDNKRIRVFYALLMLVSLILIYTTYSRTPLVALIVGLLLFIIINKKWKWILPSLLLVLTPVILFKNMLIRLTSTGILTRPPNVTYEQAMTGISKGFDMSAYVRFVNHWPKVFHAFINNPVLGVGYSAFGEAVDGDYVRMLGETGIAGLLSFGIIIILIQRTEWTIIKNTSNTFIKSLAVGILISTIALLLDALFIDIFEASKIISYFWILTAIMVKVNGFENEAREGKCDATTTCVSYNC